MSSRIEAPISSAATATLPTRCEAVPALIEAVRQARAAVPRGAGRMPSTTILPPGPADALLGVETGGIAPAFSLIGEDGYLTQAARARLTASGLSAEAALAEQARLAAEAEAQRLAALEREEAIKAERKAARDAKYAARKARR